MTTASCRLGRSPKACLPACLFDRIFLRFNRALGTAVSWGFSVSTRLVLEKAGLEASCKFREIRSSRFSFVLQAAITCGYLPNCLRRSSHLLCLWLYYSKTKNSLAAVSLFGDLLLLVCNHEFYLSYSSARSHDWLLLEFLMHESDYRSRASPY